MGLFGPVLISSRRVSDALSFFYCCKKTYSTTLLMIVLFDDGLQNETFPDGTEIGPSLPEQWWNHGNKHSWISGGDEFCRTRKDILRLVCWSAHAVGWQTREWKIVPGEATETCSCRHDRRNQRSLLGFSRRGSPKKKETICGGLQA